MSDSLTFYLLPFNPQVLPDGKIELPIRLEHFVSQLQKDFPAGSATVAQIGEQTVVRLYITLENEEPWVVANLMTRENTVMEISGRPKGMAKKLILWYRHYIDEQYPLFLVVSNNGDIHNLTKQTSLEEIESFYPYPVPED